MALDADALLERRRLKRRVVAWRAVAILAVLAAALAALWQVEPIQVIGKRDHVARLEVTGLIIENRWLEEALQKVADDPRAKALLVYVNSPGGSTYGGEALFRSLRRVAEKKPVVSVIGTLGASAGYMVAISGDRVFARETSLTGSIGVLFQSAEISRLLDKIGVSPQTITSGPLKDEPSLFHPMTERGRRVLQEMIEQTHRWFVDLVAERRSLARDKVAGLADGRIYTGRDALAEGLIDEYGGEREARSWLDRERSVPAELPVTEVPTSPPAEGWRDLVSGLVQKTFLAEPLTLDGLISVWQAQH
jgi:protease-4